MSDFYVMEYTCYNCGSKEKINIPSGESAKHRSFTCSYCRVNTRFDYHISKPDTTNIFDTIKKDWKEWKIGYKGDCL